MFPNRRRRSAQTTAVNAPSAANAWLKGGFAFLAAAIGWWFTYAQQRDAKIAAVATILVKMADVQTDEQRRVLLFALASYGKEAVDPMTNMIRYACHSNDVVVVTSQGIQRPNAYAIETMASTVARTGSSGVLSVLRVLSDCEEVTHYKLAPPPGPFDNSISVQAYPIAHALNDLIRTDPGAVVPYLCDCVRDAQNGATATCAVLLGNTYGGRNTRNIANALLDGMYYKETNEWNTDAIIALGKVLYGSSENTSWIRSRLAAAATHPGAPSAAFKFALEQKWSPDNT